MGDEQAPVRREGITNPWALCLCVLGLVSCVVGMVCMTRVAGGWCPSGTFGSEVERGYTPLSRLPRAACATGSGAR